MTKKRIINFVDLLKETLNEFLTDNCPHLAASISYYFLLSLFPMALAAISLFGIIIRSEETEDKVIDAIVNFMPLSADFVVRTIHSVSAYWETAGIIAILGFLWAGMAVFNAVRKSLNAAWGIRQPRPFLYERALELGMMIGLGLILLTSIGISAIRNYGQEIGIPLFEGSIWHITSLLVSTLLIFLAFFFIYRIVPNTHVPWRYAFFGASLAAILFQLVTYAFLMFSDRFTTSHLIYGSLGVIITLMAWTYVSSIIMLFCAKMISVYPKMKACLSVQPDLEYETYNDPSNKDVFIPSPSCSISTIISTISSKLFPNLRAKSEEE